MATTIELIFDFASPNAYLAREPLNEIADRHGAVVTLTPCLLGGIFKSTGNQAPMLTFAGVKGKLDYDALEMRRFIARHNLTAFRMNPHFPVNTLLIMRAAVAAQRLGVIDRYVDVVLAAMWEQGLKMDDPDVVLAALNAGGLDGPAILTLAQDQSVKDELAANTQAAVDRGVFGIPTIFVGDEMFFGKERLGQIDALLDG